MHQNIMRSVKLRGVAKKQQNNLSSAEHQAKPPSLHHKHHASAPTFGRRLYRPDLRSAPLPLLQLLKHALARCLYGSTLWRAVAVEARPGVLKHALARGRC